MKVYIMLILLFHDPVDGTPYTTHLQQSPLIEYITREECVLASQLKREAMLASSLRYPDLAIVDIRITCVDGSGAEFDPGDIVI